MLKEDKRDWVCHSMNICEDFDPTVWFHLSHDFLCSACPVVCSFHSIFVIHMPHFIRILIGYSTSKFHSLYKYMSSWISACESHRIHPFWQLHRFSYDLQVNIPPKKKENTSFHCNTVNSLQFYSNYVDYSVIHISLNKQCKGQSIFQY